MLSKFYLVTIGMIRSISLFRLFVDYQMISHSGDIVGYHSLMTLLPDVNIGLFSSVNGADLTSNGRRLFHSYIMDVLLGLEPWLNTSTVCTFPEPWVSVTEDFEQMISAILADGLDMLSLVPVPPASKTGYAAEFSQYIGVYGNFFYGNSIVYVNITSNQLMLSYGRADPYTLTPVGDDIFFGVASDRMWPTHIQEAIFAKSGASLQTFDQLTVTFSRSAPALFVRGCKMSDAPLPPDPDSCLESGN